MEFFKNQYFTSEFIQSVVVILIGIFVRVQVSAILRRSNINPDIKRRWIIHTRNIASGIIFIGLFTIWATELKDFAISIAAIAVALVLSTKELILCFLGGLLKASSNSFQIGDRIEVGEVRGDVIDHDLLTTKILEIGPHRKIHRKTGRLVTIPNSLFLGNVIINESYLHTYVLHTFSVHYSVHDNWKNAETCLLEAANEKCGPIIEKVQSFMNKVGKKDGIEVPKVNPTISLHFPGPDEITFILRIPAPANFKGDYEQAILRMYLERHYGKKEKK
jgi:small-conductance mechanosensitive channel